MIKKELLQKVNLIVEFLKSRYDAKAILLVGSRAVGDYKPHSDWDIYVFSDKTFPKETPDEFHKALPSALKGNELDVYLYSLKEKVFPQKIYRDVPYSEILLDTKNHFAKNLQDKSRKMFKIPPKRWTKSFTQGRLYKAQRYMHKFEDCLTDKNFGELFLRISWHYSENIIDWWFGIRQEHPLRPQDAFQHIKKRDPEFYAQLKRVFGETNYETKIDAFRKLHENLFDDKEFKKLIK